MNTDTDPCCNTCQFFWKIALQTKIGECHHDAPRVIGMTQQGPIAGWPGTQIQFWCGQYKRKLELCS